MSPSKETKAMIDPLDFKNIVDFVNQPFIPVIIIIIAIFGLFLQLYINFFRVKNKKKICYYITQLQRNSKEENAVFKLDDRLISKINFIFIYLWNTGWETIDSKDIAKNSYLRLVTENKKVRIDRIEIFRTNNVSNDFKLIKNKENDSFKIDFDYFNPKEGIVLRIINTQTEFDDIKGFFKICGVIKGFGDPILTSLPPYPIFPLFKNKVRTRNFFLLLILIFMMTFGIISLILDSQTIPLIIVISVLVNSIPQLNAFFFQGRLPIEFEMIETIEIENLIVEKNKK